MLELLLLLLVASLNLITGPTYPHGRPAVGIVGMTNINARIDRVRDRSPPKA